MTFFIISCNARWDKSFLLGNWESVEWKNMDSGSLLNGQMDFTFSEDNRYTVDYGSQDEKGRFWIANEYLHTVEDGKAEKKVRITLLNSDSLIFEMNRAGILEQVILIKK